VFPPPAEQRKPTDFPIRVSAKDLASISPTCLCATFTCPDPKSAKRQSSLQCLVALLGSVHAKAGCETLVKSSPGVNFTINISVQMLRQSLFCTIQFDKKTILNFANINTTKGYVQVYWLIWAQFLLEKLTLPNYVKFTPMNW